MNSIFVLTQYSGIFGPIAKVLGVIMSALYNFFDDVLGIQNIGLTIIVFTIIIYLIMIPMTYQQQKFSRMQRVMAPEQQKIQKKYKNKKDQNSMMLQNAELQDLYKKYGVKPTGSCLFMAITLIILFPLYRVIYNVPAYVGRVKDSFDGVVTGIMGASGYQNTITTFLENVSKENSIFRQVRLDFDTADTTYNSIVDVLYKCTAGNWETLSQNFPDLSSIMDATQNTINHMNSFFGANIVYSPKALIMTGIHEHAYLLIAVAIIIPILSAGSQLLNIRLMPQPDTSAVGDNNSQMGNTMKTMNYMMPIYSLFIVFFLPLGVGIYWVAGAVIRIVQQVIINKLLDNMDMEAYLAKVAKKNAAKDAKHPEKAERQAAMMKQAAKVNTRDIGKGTKNINANSMAAKAASVQGANAINNTKRKYKADSMAARANMVRDSYEKANAKPAKTEAPKNEDK